MNVDNNLQCVHNDLQKYSSDVRCVYDSFVKIFIRCEILITGSEKNFTDNNGIDCSDYLDYVVKYIIFGILWTRVRFTSVLYVIVVLLFVIMHSRELQ